MQVFKTVREAAIAGCAEANPLSIESNWEYGGLILKVKGGFTYTPPGTSKKNSHIVPSDIFSPYVPDYDALIAAGDRGALQRAVRKAGAVAFYHIHPCKDDEGRARASISKYFSMGDLMSMKNEGFSSAYLAVSCNGKVYEATPKVNIVYPDQNDWYRQNPAGLGPVIGSF